MSLAEFKAACGCVHKHMHIPLLVIYESTLTDWFGGCSYDGGQSYAEIPTDETILGWAKKLLPGMH